MLDVYPSGYYAWSSMPLSKRDKANRRLTGLIKQFWLESCGVYGNRKIHSDLRDIVERCGIDRVHRLMVREGLRAQVGYRRPRHRGGESHSVVPNRLNREINLTPQHLMKLG